MPSVIVLGANGRFGRAAVDAFGQQGWDVTALARSWPTPPATRHVTVDVTDSAALADACMGHDVIVNAINPPYHHWARVLPAITRAVISAAQASGATVMIPGNVYTYGTVLPERLCEDTAHVGDTRKGRLRIQMETAYRDSGVRTIVLRGGDFIEAEKTGAWFDSHMAHKAWEGKFSYPGPRDLPHAWAYLPDMARAMALLASRRAQMAPFEEFGFEGMTLTGDDLGALVSDAVGRDVRFTGFPWVALRIMALWSPLMREVLEMRYLWQRPHRVDGSKLRRMVPEFEPTPAAKAIAQSLAPYSPARQHADSAPRDAVSNTRA